MAFPALQGSITGTNGTTATTTPVVNLPTGIKAGELIVVLFRSAVAGAIGWPNATWLEQFDASSDAADDNMALAVRKADGTEGSTITLSSGNGKFAALAFRVSGAQEPENRTPEFSTVATGTNTTPDPTTCTPTGGAKDYMWVWVGGWSGEQTSPPASNPTNYPTTAGADSGTAGTVDTNCRVAVAIRSNLNAASEDPGSWTISVAPTGWTAYCMAIHPAVPVDDLLQNARKDGPPRGGEKNLKRKRAFEADPPNLLTSVFYVPPETPATPRQRGPKDLAKKRKKTPILQEMGSPITLSTLDAPFNNPETIETKKRKLPALDTPPNSLVSNLFRIVQARPHKIHPEHRKRKKVLETFEPNNFVLLTTLATTVVPRYHTIKADTKRKKNNYQEEHPNNLFNLSIESSPRQIVQQFTERKKVVETVEFSNLTLLTTPVQTEPLILNPQVETTKRSKNNYQDTIPNLNTSTFTTASASPRNRGPKDLAKKKKRFPQLDVIPNLLDSTLASVYQTRNTLIIQPRKRKKQALIDIIPNLLTSTLSVAPANPIFLSQFTDQINKRKRVQSEEIVPNSLVNLLSVTSVPRSVIQQFLKRRKAKLEDTVANLLTSTLGAPADPPKPILEELIRLKKKKTIQDPEILNRALYTEPINPRAALEDFIRLKRKKAISDPEILNRALFTEPINPKVTTEDWRLIARRKAKLELEFRNNSILLPPPGNPPVGAEDFLSSISKDIRRRKSTYSISQEPRNLIIYFERGFEDYLRRYLNDRDGKITAGPEQNLNDEVSQDRHLSNYIRRYLNDKTTES